MAFYETIFIVRQDVSTNQVEKMTKEFSDIISNNNGKVAKTENWGLRTLAYLVKKNKKGHYVMFQIDGEGSTIAELERQFRLHEDVTRYMTVRIDEISKDESPIMKQKAA